MLGKREIQEKEAENGAEDEFVWTVDEKRKRIVSECLFRHKYRVIEPKTPQIKYSSLTLGS